MEGKRKDMTNSEKIKSLLSDIGLLDKFSVEMDHQNDYVLVPIPLTVVHTTPEEAKNIAYAMNHLQANGFDNGVYNGEIVIYRSADTIIPASDDPAGLDAPDQH